MAQKQMKKVSPAANIRTGRVAGESDVRSEPLYDTYTLSAGVLPGFNNRFFSVPAGGSKTLAHTNMTNAGQLPVPNAFRCQGISFEAYTVHASDWDFLIKLLDSSYVRFFVGTKDYVIAPLSVLAGKVDLEVWGGKTDGSQVKAMAMLGDASEKGFKFAMDKVIKIASGENFGVDIVSYVSATLSADLKIRCFLEGIRYTEVR